MIKKFMALKHLVQRALLVFMAFLTIIPKAENPLRRNQKFATSLDFSCKDNLSAIRAINSEFVGFPLVLLTV